MFKKLFGKKNDGFFMQIDDAPTPKVAAKAAPTPTPVAAAPAKTETAAPVAAVTEVAPPAAETEQKVAAGAKAAAKAAEKAAAKAAKAEKKSQTAPTKDLAPTSAPVVAASAPAPTLPPITNFATDYLIKPSSDSNRRRPGANMSKFLELAREAKIPVNIKK